MGYKTGMYGGSDISGGEAPSDSKCVERNQTGKQLLLLCVSSVS